MSVDFSKYRSPTELRIQWMRILKYTDEEILDSIEHNEVQSLEIEELNLSNAIKLLCKDARKELQEKINKMCEDVSDFLVFF